MDADCPCDQCNFCYTKILKRLTLSPIDVFLHAELVTSMAYELEEATARATKVLKKTKQTKRQ